MARVKTQELPEIFSPADSKWASAAAGRGEIRRIGRGIYTTNLEEPLERLVLRKWFDVAAIRFPEAVVVDRSAHDSKPAEDGSLFLDIGPGLSTPRAVKYPGLTIKPRRGPGPVKGDTEFIGLYQSSAARIALDNMRASRARSGVSRTLTKAEMEHWLDRQARSRGDAWLNELRDQARELAPALDANAEFADLDGLIGAMFDTRESDLQTAQGQARRRGQGYDTDRLELFEILRAALAVEPFPKRENLKDRLNLGAFFESYFSNWIEGTEFEVDEAEEIVFEGRIPPQRPADAHDVRGTFEAIIGSRTSPTPKDATAFVESLVEDHRLVMGGRPEVSPGSFKDRSNRVGSLTFVSPDLVEGTLYEGHRLLESLPGGMPRAIFAMFLVSEVHPFADGNGRVSRLAMNAELTFEGLCRIMIPPVLRDEYLSSLRALSTNANPRPLWRMLDRAQRWASRLRWADRDDSLELLERSNAFVTPAEAGRLNIHLVDPDQAAEPGATP